MNLFDVPMEMKDVYIYIYGVRKFFFSVKNWKNKINFLNLFGYEVRK